MDNNEELYKSIQHFSDAVLVLYESIKDSLNNTQTSSANNIKDIADAIYDNAIELTTINEDVKKTKTNTETILAQIKALRRQKENGFFDKLNTASGKTKGLVEGIKTTVLMAGGLMALGLAFKFVGEVDFASVISLALAMPLVTSAFLKINDANLSQKDALKTASIMAIMSGGILASSYILANVADVSLFQLITALGVGVTLGVTMYLISESVKNINTKKIQNILPIISVMPLVASGIYLSGKILQNMPDISLNQVLSAIGVGVAMGSTLIPIALAARTLGSTKVVDILKITGVMPVVAYAINYSGGILQNMPIIQPNQVLSAIGVGIALSSVLIPISFASKLMGNDMKKMYAVLPFLPLLSLSIVTSALALTLMPDIESAKILKSALTIGLATTAILAPIALMSKLNIGIKEIALGTVSVAILSAGISASSWILSIGKYTGGPTVDWAKGVGLSLLSFVPTVIALGAISATGVGALALGLGMAMTLAVSYTIVKASKILRGGKYTGGPTEKWAKGVGMSITAFANALAMLSPKSITDWIMNGSFEKRLNNILKISSSLPEIAKVIKGGDYTGGPSEEWAKGIGLTITSFASSLDSISNAGGFFEDFEDNLQSIMGISYALPKIAKVIKGGDYSGGPTVAWSQGIGSILKSMAVTIATLDDELDPSDTTNWIDPIKKMSTLMPILANNTKGIDFSNYPTTKWSEGMKSFLDIFSNNIGFANDTYYTNIDKTSSALFRLASALKSVGKNLGNIKNIPDLGNLNSSFITMSLIDADNLNEVISTLDSKSAAYLRVIKKLETKNVVINTPDNFNKAKTDIKNSTSKNKTNTNNLTTVDNSENMVLTRGASDDTEKAIKVNIDKAKSINENLDKVYRVLKKIETGINSISENTENQRKIT